MDSTILEFARELADKSQEIGKLTEQLKQKDLIIAGLVAQLGQPHECKCNNESKSKVNESGHVYTVPALTAPIVAPIPAPATCDTTVTSIEDVAPVTTKQEVTEEEPKAKRKYTKRSSFWNGKKSSESPAVVQTVSQKGGTVFKSFDPLDLNKVVVEGANTSAYIVPNSKRNYVDKISAIAAGLGSSSSI